METKTINQPSELEEDKIYSFGDLHIKAMTDYDFNPIIYLYADKGEVIIQPHSNNKIGVQSTKDI